MAPSKERTKYDILIPMMLPEGELRYYDFPSMDPKKPGCILPPLGKTYLNRLPSSATRQCMRCKKSYQVDSEGMPTEMQWCLYHEKELTKDTNLHPCCNKDDKSEPCKWNTWHLSLGPLLLAAHEGFLETQLKKDREPNNHGVFGLSTKRCYTRYGLELTRVTVVDYKLDVIYDKFVKPDNAIIDYNTQESGLKRGDLNQVTTRLADVRKDLMQFISSKSILVGHRLNQGLECLKLVHKYVVDISVLYPTPGGPEKRKTPYGCLLHQKLEGTWDMNEAYARVSLRVAYHEAGF